MRAPRPRLDDARSLLGDEPGTASPTKALVERAVARGLLRESQLESLAFAALDSCDKCDGSGRAGYDFRLCVRCGGCGIEFNARHLPTDIATFVALCSAPSAIAAAEAAARELYVRYVGAEPRALRWYGSSAEHGYRLATQYRVPAWPRGLSGPPYDQWNALSSDFSVALVSLEARGAAPSGPYADALVTLAESGFWLASIDAELVLFAPTDGLR